MALSPAALSFLPNVSYAFILAGTILILITFRNTDRNSLVAQLAGYSAITCAILLLAGLAYTKLVERGGGILGSALTWSLIISNLFPFFIILFVLGMTIAFLSIYFDRISENTISESYYTFSFFSTLFLLIQISMLVNTIRKNQPVTRTLYAILTLLGTINIIIVLTIFSILKYFVTDC